MNKDIFGPKAFARVLAQEPLTTRTPLTSSQISNITEQLGADPEAGVVVSKRVLEAWRADQLINYAESRWNGITADFKHELDRKTLVGLIGKDATKRLESLIDNNYTTIVLRRSCPYGQHIPFHCDEALKTVKVYLNASKSYYGGQVVYLTQNRAVYYNVQPGQATVHDNTVAHGVTEFEGGVRYALFLLRKR